MMRLMLNDRDDDDDDDRADLTGPEWRQQQSLSLMKYLQAFHTTHWDAERAATLFLDEYPSSFVRTDIRKSVALQTKAAIGAGSTTDSAWAKPLVGVPELTAAYLTEIRPREVLGQLSGAIRVPVNVPVPIFTTQPVPASVWVGQGLPKAVTKFPLMVVTLAPNKVGLVVVVTKELLQFGIPETAGALRAQLSAQLVRGVNQTFLDPTIVAVPDVRPGSITSQGTLVATANNAVTDANAVLAALLAARPEAMPTLIMSPGAVKDLHGTGQHQELTYEGGTALGARVIVTGAAGKTITAVDPSAILISDRGLEIDLSDQATIELNDAPVAPTAATVVRSLFGENLVGFRGERLVTWAVSDPLAVQYSTRA